MLRVRAQLSFHTFKYGDVFTIDETHPDWAEPLAEGWVAPVAHEVTVPAAGWKPARPFPVRPFWVYTTGTFDPTSAPPRPSSTFVPGQPETL